MVTVDDHIARIRELSRSSVESTEMMRVRQHLREAEQCIREVEAAEGTA